MNKSDLKSGMIVRTNAGFLYMVLRDTGMNVSETSDRDILLGITSNGVIRNMGWMNLSGYKDDMTDDDDSFDIVEVFSVAMASEIGDFRHYRSVWIRN